jgi:hypothetical protein
MNLNEVEIKQLHTICRNLYKAKKTEFHIKEVLRAKGANGLLADFVYDNIIAEIDEKAYLRKQFLVSLIITIMGVSLNIVSYNRSANDGSGSFILFWGIVVGGIVSMIRCLILYKR